MQTKQTRPLAPGAFTLVELLTVLVVIGILSGLLFPSFANAKRRATMTVCLNNLRQIGMGFAMYTGENKGRFPLRVAQKGSTGMLPVKGGEFFDFRFFDEAIGGADPAAELPTYPRANERPLFPYLKQFETFHCPSDSGFTLDRLGKIRPSLWKHAGCSYWYNARPDGPGERLGFEGLAGKDVSYVKYPDRFILMYEPPSRLTESGLLSWHQRSKAISPLLFVDLHVSAYDLMSPNQTQPGKILWHNSD